MENSGEVTDDQDSGWLEVKKKHRSSARFSVLNWAGRFSGKNSSSDQLPEAVLCKTGNLHGKQRSQPSEKRTNLSACGLGNVDNSVSVSDKDKSSIPCPEKSVIKQDRMDHGYPSVSGLLGTDSNSRIGDTPKVLKKDKSHVVPKIKWGNLEDDALMQHHENNSQADLKFCSSGDNNLVAMKCESQCNLVSHVSSCINIQENKLAATFEDVSIGPDETISLANKENVIERTSNHVSGASSLDMEVSVMNDKRVSPNDTSNCKEAQNEHSIPIDGHPSCEEVGLVVESQLPLTSAVDQPRNLELPVTSGKFAVVSQDSESLHAEKSGLEISGDQGTVLKLQLPVVSAVDESKVSEKTVTKGNPGTSVIFLDNELLLPERGDAEISKEVGRIVKLQLPVISEETELQIYEASLTSENSSAVVTGQCINLSATAKHGPEISGESTGAASVEDSSVLDDRMHYAISKVQSISGMGEGDAVESKERFRERLWCFLFENLNRAVDELYLLCELECDVDQMKEAILVLEEAASDFKELGARVQEFENVKKLSPQLIDGTPITLKSDHRRPHALSWEVRRMTTSPHRAEILSSSLEAFKKIQQERVNLLEANNTKTMGVECSSSQHASGDDPKKPAGKANATPIPRDSTMKYGRQSGGSDVTHGKLNGEKRNVETGRFNKVNCVHNGHDSSVANSSRLTSRDSSAAGPGKSKRDHDPEKLLKKDKMMAESTVEKNLKSTDQLKKQISISDKDKEKRNSTSWKSMDAWKEKRNWEDILSSPFRFSSRISHSPGMNRKSAERARVLHDKLMSPEKKKKTALDLKKEAEEKHARAMRIRSELENERAQKLQRTSEKLSRVNEWQAVRTMKLREGMHARHQRGESRHEAYLAQVVRRAGDESSKVNEVRFITSLNEENKKLILRQKLHDWELRRAEKLQVIRSKQKEDMAREEAVFERRKLIEAEKLQRLAETQRKKEEAKVRREEERKASSAAREARALEQLRRREERAKAQQEEAELLAQKLAERLSESEQRRKFYLEQIRERASMDLRDQSSPFLRRSTNKEGQGRSTTNSGEDRQENSVVGTGGPSLATVNATHQQSLKRRIKKIRQRLMALKYEFPEPSVGSENAGIGYRVAVGTARAKIGRWLQELQRLRQERKEGASKIGLINAEMIKFLEGKDPELQVSRQAGLIDFIASALPASHTSKPEACQVTIHLLKLLKVVLSIPANRSYFLAQNLLPPIIPMLSAALENYIKIAASINTPGSTNLPSSKTSVENFESISEVVDNFLWIVGTVIGHNSSDEREAQMHDGLLELLVAYQVIHRLRDLFALYDRPQVEGSPFPSSILLGIHLLVVLTYRPNINSSIDWEASPIDMALSHDQETKLAEITDPGHSSGNMTSEDNGHSASTVNGSTVASSLNESCSVNESSDSVSVKKHGEKELTDSSLQSNNANINMTDALDESQKFLIDDKYEKLFVNVGAVQNNGNISSLKQPLAFLLSAISETGLVSLPSLLTAVLLQANTRLSPEQGSYVLPSNFEEVATGVLKVLNNLARLDITFMQRMLAGPDLKMEFFHLMSFLLTHCTCKWKAAGDQVGLLLLESLSLLGYFALFHAENQAVLRWGKGPTILHKVCDLPFVFFSDPDLMPALAGTLVAACYGCEQNKAVVQQELSMDMLLSLLRSCRSILAALQSNLPVENLPTEDSSESNQQSSELRKSQGDVPLKSNRYNARSGRVSLGKGGATGNGIRSVKMRNQRDCKAIKANEEMSFKYSPLAPENAMMLHCRFPSTFIDRAEQFFSAGII